MKPIFDTISFYPYSSEEIREGYYSIIRYNSLKHEWEEIGKETCLPTEIDTYIHRLNMESGIITERFIVRYEQ